MSSRRRTQPWVAFVFRRHDSPQTLHGRDRIDRPRDDLTGSGSLGLVGEAAFQQLSVGENDAELIVQSMEQSGEIRLGRGIHRSRRSRRRRRLRHRGEADHSTRRWVSPAVLRRARARACRQKSGPIRRPFARIRLSRRPASYRWSGGSPRRARMLAESTRSFVQASSIQTIGVGGKNR